MSLELEHVESEALDEESTPSHFELTSYPADYTLELLHQKWNQGEIIIPKFQRGFVWKKPQASRLIESFMMGLPIPQIFLYTDAELRYLVIDGQQRLRSIFYFFDGVFGEPDSAGRSRAFKLEGLNDNSKWEDKAFADFDDFDKRKLKQSVLRAIIVKQLNPNDDSSVYHIFERLNTGGTLLKDQEVRNCVYEGRLNDMMIELNEYPTWRTLLGRPRPDPRQKDVELILRYLSLSHSLDKYSKPMKDFMSSFMKRNRNPTDAVLEKEREQFKKTCELIHSKLGSKPFHPRGPLNVAAFDAVFVAFSKHVEHFPDDLKARKSELFANPEFTESTLSGTTDPDVVKKRLELADSILFG